MPWRPRLHLIKEHGKKKARRANATKEEGSEEGRVGDWHPLAVHTATLRILEPNVSVPHCRRADRLTSHLDDVLQLTQNAIPHSSGLPRRQSHETLAEAEKRANEDIFAICKALGVERTLDDCPGGPHKWSRLFDILEGIKKSGLDGITLKKILRARMITRVVRYVVDFCCFAVRFDAAPVRGQTVSPLQHLQ